MSSFEDLEVLGRKIHCPVCDEEIYVENATKRVCCESCSLEFYINEDFEPAGKVINCPFDGCGEKIYAEKPGLISCPGCDEKIRIGSNLELEGKMLECPFCNSEVYVYEAGEITCWSCEKSFRVGKKNS